MAQRRAGGRSTTGRPRRPYTIRDQVALRRLEGFVVSPDGGRVILQIGRARSREEPPRHPSLVGQRRRDRSSPADPIRQARLRARPSRPTAAASTSWRVLAAATRQVVTSVPRRRQAGAGDAIAHRRRVVRAVPGRDAPRVRGAGVPRAAPTRSRRPPSGSKAEATRPTGDRPDPRPAVRPPLGPVEDRPPPPPLRAARGRRARRRRHARDGRRRAEQAVRRQRAVHVHAGRDAASSSRPATPVARRPGAPTSTCSWRRSTRARRRASSRLRTGRPIRTRRSARTGRCWPTWRWIGPGYEADKLTVIAPRLAGRRLRRLTDRLGPQRRTPSSGRPTGARCTSWPRTPGSAACSRSTSPPVR